MNLSRREHQMVELLAKGSTNKEIATALGLTTGTVKVYLFHLKSKDPDKGSRYTAVKYLARDHERVMAIRLNEWIQARKGELSQEALNEIKLILADQVAEVLK